MYSFLKRFIKKNLKNKFLIITIAVIIISIFYKSINKIIDDNSIYSNISEQDGTEEVDSGSLFSDNEVLLQDIDKEDKKLESIEVDNLENDVNNEDDISNEKNNEIENKIYIYITGEVVVPGVVILNEESRISDAINAAGGVTQNADISKVNLVYMLQDGMKVNIPSYTELKNNSNFEYIITTSGDGRSDDKVYDNVDSLKNKTSKSQENVNINTATQTELESLPGIGPSLALKIINYRKENGKFSSIEDIKNVSGIGESKFETLKKYICF